MPEFDQTLSLAAQHAQKGQLAQAQQLMEQALDMDDSMSARLQVANLGVGYGLVTRASQLYESVLNEDPRSVAAQAGLGRVATDTGQHSKATAIYTELVKQYPDSDTLRRNALVALQYDPAVPEKERLQAALDWGQWAIRRAGGSEQPPLQTPQQPQQRPRPQSRSLVDASAGALPRVGFVSADFCQHTVGLFVKDILMALGQRWSVYVYHSRGLEDWVSKLIKTRCHWRSVVDMDDVALVNQIRHDGIDILVDLSGHTAGSRLTAFAHRPAPVMVSWLGYFATTGLPYIDAVLLDPWSMPANPSAAFVEPLVSLPAGRFFYKPVPWAPKTVAAPPCVARDYVTFGCFNNTAKINDAVIDLWARVLHAVPDSRLVLKWRTFNDATYRGRIEAAFVARGIAASRIECRGPGFHVDVLKEYADIDIALDPFPFTGGLTSCEALWMGVPVVTLPQSQVVSRQTYALLSAIGLPDWVADSPDAYVHLACKLANNTASLAHMRTQLRAHMQSSTLMDLEAHVTGLQQALLAIHERVISPGDMDAIGP